MDGTRERGRFVDSSPDKYLQVALGGAVAVLAIGGLGWLWTEEWRWAITAVVLAVVVIVAGAVIGGITVKPPGG
jgi:CDP-diglyceride synthetase